MNKPVSSKRFDRNNPLKVITACIVCGLLWSVFPLVGWSSYALEGIKTSCSLKWKSSTFNSLSYNITVFIVVLLGPLIFLIATSYRLIQLVSILIYRFDI
jgi:hypothetical protein